MAEDSIKRKPLARRRVKGLHVVDAFADKGSLPAEVVVDIGYRARIGIQAGFSGEQLGKPGALGSDQAGSQAWLEHPIAPFHTARGRVD